VQIDGVDRPANVPITTPNRPIFCYLAIIACTIVFVFQIRVNGWAFQPLTCPAQCQGQPCNEDGT